ncbi:MAG: hypothetical protein WCV92_01865 [Candidatus Buchananbacteria bacterium]
MTPNKIQNFNPEQRIGGAPMPEKRLPEHSLDTEGSVGGGEFFERDGEMAIPEIQDRLYNVPANVAQVPNEYKILESIMEEGLADMYAKMLPMDQQKFKQKGEETANLIITILSAPKVKIKKIFELLKSWLKMIPGVNRFFLEQMAKIKTDKIVGSIKDKKII